MKTKTSNKKARAKNVPRAAGGKNTRFVFVWAMAVFTLTAAVGMIQSYEYGKRALHTAESGLFISGTTYGPSTSVSMQGFQPEEPPILPAPADAPPAKIKVGPNHYAVKWTSGEYLAAQGALAQSDIAKHIIWLNPKRTTETLRDDVLHELMHCAADLGSAGGRARSPYDVEEDEIEYISSGLLQVMQDNPQLLAWLTQTK